MSSSSQFSPKTFKRLLQANKNPQILDIRTSEEFEDFNFGGKLVDLNQLLQNPKSYIAAKNRKVIVICYSGIQSNIAVTILRKKGYRNAYNLEGGLEAFLAL